MKGQPTPTDTLSRRLPALSTQADAGCEDCFDPAVPTATSTNATDRKRRRSIASSRPATRSFLHAGGRRRIPAAFRPAGVRRHPEVRLARTRVSARQVRRLPSRAPGGLFVQATRLLSILRRTADGGAGYRAFRSTPPPSVKPPNATSSKSSVATSHGPPSPTSGSRPTTRGQVIYRFKQPFRDGSTHVVLDPLDFIARLAALVPRPRLNLTRFHGVFAPNCKHRESVVPKRKPRHEKPDKPLAPMTPNAAPETRLRHRHRDLPQVRWHAARHRLHRKSGCHRRDPRAHSCTRGSHHCPSERTSTQHRAPRRATPGQAPVENDRLTLGSDRYPGNRRFGQTFRLQRPPPHPQPDSTNASDDFPRAPRQSTVLRNHPVSSGYSSYPRAHSCTGRSPTVTTAGAVAAH